MAFWLIGRNSRRQVFSHQGSFKTHRWWTHLMPRSHIHGSPRRFRYGSNPTDDPGKVIFRSQRRMHNASTTTSDYGCNTEIYGLIRIATDDAGSYPWLILRQIRECVTWALGVTTSTDNRNHLLIESVELL